MRGNLQEAINNTTTSYKELIEVGNDIVNKCIGNCNALIAEIQSNVNNLSNDAIRDYMLRLALCSYSFSEIKEKSALKAQCAEALRKEAYAREFAVQTGPVAQKETQATINIADETVVEYLYEYVASMMKTKQDELHRVVDVLKTLIMSRLSEAKITTTIDTTSIREE